MDLIFPEQVADSGGGASTHAGADHRAAAGLSGKRLPRQKRGALVASQPGP